MEKYKIIVNPTAGRGASGRAIPMIESLLRKNGLTFDLVCTERPLHAIELARRAAVSYDVVVAMGGDGTANEVMNGLMQAKEKRNTRCALGVLCVGRGNDFAYGMGIPHDLEEGCQILARGHRRRIDVGCVIVDDASEARYFGNGVGIGFDAVVGFEALKMKHLHGFLCYLVAALKTLLFLFKAPTVRIEYSGRTILQPSLMISVMNGQRMGGGFQMAPEAKPDDGQFDLCIAGDAGRLQLLSLMLKFMKGTQAGDEIITTGRTSRISVTALEGVLPAHADGETLCTEGRKLELDLLAGQLEILTKCAE